MKNFTGVINSMLRMACEESQIEDPAGKKRYCLGLDGANPFYESFRVAGLSFFPSLFITLALKENSMYYAVCSCFLKQILECLV